LISQLGPDPAHRHQTLARRHTAATEMIPALVTTRRQNHCQLAQRKVFTSAAKLAPFVLP
jgi:hypothetical protein